VKGLSLRFTIFNKKLVGPDRIEKRDRALFVEISRDSPMITLDKQAMLATAKPQPSQQHLVDEAQARIRQDLASGRRSLFKPAPARPQPTQDVLDARLAEELELIRRQLGSLGDVLSNYPILLQRHGSQLQSIDVMQQTLAHLSRVIGSADRNEAVEQVSLIDLRSRLTRTALT
jgi:hypothetical protein